MAKKYEVVRTGSRGRKIVVHEYPVSPGTDQEQRTRAKEHAARLGDRYSVRVR